jgi:ADP-heptose:LPS heptosyltransferase
MKNSSLIFLDCFTKILFSPLSLFIRGLNKLILIFFPIKNKDILIVKFLGAGNFIALSKLDPLTSFDVITEKRNFTALKKIKSIKNIYTVDSKNIITLFFTIFKLFFILTQRKYYQTINLETESTFAKFISAVPRSNILSGVSNLNKSYFDFILYTKYLVSPFLLNKVDIVNLLINEPFSPSTNVIIYRAIVEQQKNYLRSANFKSQTISIFPSCSDTDTLRRLNIIHWTKIIKRFSTMKNVSNINVIFPRSDDIQFDDFTNFKKLFNRFSIITTNYKNFYSSVLKSDLIVTVDSQALHIAQALDKKTIAIYGPTSPYGVNLGKNTYPIYKGLACSPCTHKYLKLPCSGAAMCMSFKSKDFSNLC